MSGGAAASTARTPSVPNDCAADAADIDPDRVSFTRVLRLVRRSATGRVEITAHNHNFAVDADPLPPEAEPTHWDLNDQTLEGLRHRSLPLFSVQYHPEAAPGPHDSHYLFDEFVRLMRGPSR